MKYDFVSRVKSIHTSLETNYTNRLRNFYLPLSSRTWHQAIEFQFEMNKQVDKRININIKTTVGKQHTSRYDALVQSTLVYTHIRYNGKTYYNDKLNGQNPQLKMKRNIGDILRETHAMFIVRIAFPCFLTRIGNVCVFE